jgi:hypothetical protein
MSNRLERREVTHMSKSQNVRRMLAAALAVGALAAAYPAAGLAGDGGGGPSPDTPLAQK